jgi:hypothetical protein
VGAALWSNSLPLFVYSKDFRKPIISRSSNSETTKPAAANEKDPSPRKKTMENYGKVPLSFESNKGQIDPEVRFFSRGAGYGFYLTPKEAVMVLNGKAAPATEIKTGNEERKPGQVIRMKLAGASTARSVTGLEKLPGITNYFIGNDPTEWKTNVANYAKVKYERVYRGVDVIYYGNQEQLEFDFIVAPRANPNAIKLEFEGVDQLAIADNGDLILSVQGGEVRQRKPFIYQEVNGQRSQIEGHYVIFDTKQVGFRLGRYDRSRQLVIDPVVSYSTYLGGFGVEQAGTIGVDTSGNAIVVGSTWATNFPTRFSIHGDRGGVDAYVSKINPTGTQLVYSTYLGGASGDVARDVAVDASGNAYITGTTSSTDFPTTVGAYDTTAQGGQDVFVTKLTSAGGLSYSTYLGSNTSDTAAGIAVDTSGNAYVNGLTNSAQFPVLNAFQSSFAGGTCGTSPNTRPCFDLFVTKFNATGSALIFSTYLGGTSDDFVNGLGGGITVDSSNNVYLTGSTQSTNFPLLNAFQSTHAPGASETRPGTLNEDLFVTKLDASGSSLIYSTYLGGAKDETGMDIAVNSANEAYVTGNTFNSTDFPTTPGAFNTSSGNSFVAKFSATGDSLAYSTYLLGARSNSIAVNLSGNAYVTGETGDFVNAIKLSLNGDSLVWSITFGGTESAFQNSFAQQDGRGIAVDSSGNAYIHGDVWASNFPTTAGALQPNLTTNTCGSDLCGDSFVTKIADISGYTISGRVTGVGGGGISNVKIALTGSLKMAILTDSNGNYSLPNLMPNGSFTVTPSKNFFTFEPVNLTFNNLSADQTADFVGTIPNVTINGSVKNANNAGVSGVTVTLSGAQSQSVVTDNSGTFSFTNLPSGNTYTVTPTRGADVFDPPNKTFVQISDNQTFNFKLIYQISGQVTDAGGVPTPGVTLTLTGTQSAVATSDANGNYLFTKLGANGNYTVTPSKAGILVYNFVPVSQNYADLTGNQVLNFSYTTSTKVALFPIADAYVEDGGNAAANFGGVTPLLLKTANQAGQRRDVYLKYDLSAVSRKITNAKLRIFAGLSAAGTVSTSAYSVTDTEWQESAINWNNKPVRSSTAITGGATTVTSTTFATYELDVTSYIVAEQSAGRALVSLALHNPSNSTPHILLNAREAATDKPQLLLTTNDNSNAAPTVNLTSPTGGASFTAPASVALSASASDSDGNISKVEYYSGTNLIGTATTSPYSATWSNVAAGSYALMAVATDNQGLTSVSSGVQITITNANVPPAVNITAPLSNATFPAGSNITVSATAMDVDGSVTQVEFLSGTASLGVDDTAPYNVNWNNVPSGSHSLTARATDNAGGITTSAAVNINSVWQTGFSAVADAYVKDGSTASTNFGTALELQVQQGATESNRESYLKFDLTAITGTNTIAQVRLRVFGRLSDTSGTNVGVGVYSVSNTTWGENGSGSITWNTKPPANNPVLATTTVTDNVAGWYEFDVSSYIQAEKIAGRNVVSLVLKSQSPSNPFVTFNSREASTNRPQLVVWTTEASRKALFAVGSSNLNAGDTAAKARLEGLGFTVTTKVANNNLNTADADGKALVVISSTCNASNVTTKFRHVIVPVVNWEFDVHDELGMTGTTSGTDFGTSPTAQTDLTIANSGHVMAAGLSGMVTVVSTASNFSWGLANANAAKIATLTSDANKSVIFGYGAGTAMPGLEAPARRVALFMTDLTAGSFNSNASALFDAAVRWATELSTAPTISLMTPSSGPAGTVVTINGSNFGLTQGSSNVMFNGVAASPSSWDDKIIVVAVPLYATAGMMVVTVNGVASNGVLFAVGEIDSDGDGLADWWEMQYFGNLAQAAEGDPDGDGLSNLQEYQQGRNPTVNALFEDAGVNLKVFTPLAPTMP